MWVGGKASQSQESRADPRGADPSPGSTWQCPAHAPRTTRGEQRLGQAGKVEVLVLRCPGSQISEEWNTSSVCAPLWPLPLWEAGWIHTQLAHKSQIWHTKSALIPHCECGQGKSLCWGQEKLHRGADVTDPSTRCGIRIYSRAAPGPLSCFHWLWTGAKAAIRAPLRSSASAGLAQAGSG